ncbi:MAG: glutamate-5-semialdehyde dehydrogenase [Nitrospirae bacterium]|nr:MAG: glutamate-5-semialdehyde dehydrogenase [Nitrospirota bacterium]
MVALPPKLYVEQLGKRLKQAARVAIRLPGQKRIEALLQIQKQLQEQRDAIVEANQRDVGNIPKDLDPQDYRLALERVRLTEDMIDEMNDDIQRLIESPDPIGAITQSWTTPDGLQVGWMRCPLGVIAVITDLGPHMAVQAFSTCIKTGNLCLFRGGSEWMNTNAKVAQCIREALQRIGYPEDATILLDRQEPEAALEAVRLTKYIDAAIAKGKPALRRGVREQARVPIIGDDGGVSHMYIDRDIEIPLAQTLVVNAKVQDPAASNAIDTLLVHQAVARHVLPGLVRRLLEEFKVDVRGCPKTVSMMGVMEMTGHLGVKPASDQDWEQKFQSLTLCIKIVRDLDEALDHIAQYGPGHTDAIVTRDYETAMRFIHEVDAGAVFVNASTRLHGGESLELGPQVGINSSRFHARGPLTLHALTCQKIVALGTGQLRQPHPIPQTYHDAMMLSPKF